eukprot:g5239.t1
MKRSTLKMTMASREDCHKVLKYLRDTLRSRGASAYVKWKVLNIYKHVCLKGSEQFKQCLQRESAPIKELQSYRGRRDPIKGDQPNEQVRRAAKAAVQAIFSNRKVIPTTNNGTSVRMKGISSDAYANVGTVDRSKFGRSKQRGRRGGGPPIDRSDAPSGWSLKSNRGEASIHRQKTDYSAPDTSSARKAGTKLRHGGRSFVKSSKPRRKGGVGGGWGSANVELRSQSGSSTSEGRRSVSPNRTRQEVREAKSRLAALEVGKAVSDGNFERQLVDRLVGGAGIRAEVPKKKIAEFCLRCRTLDPNVVVPILEESLQASKWQVRARTVALSIALGRDRGCKAFRIYFQGMDSAWLADLLESDSSKKVRRRVQEALLELYPDEYEAAESDEDENGDADGGDDGNLLGMGDGGIGAAPGEEADDGLFGLSMGAAESSKMTSSKATDDGFDFITHDDDDDAEKEAGRNEGFSFIDVGGNDDGGEGAEEGGDMGDMFSGMSLGGNASAANVPAPHSGGGGDTDVFSGLFDSAAPSIPSSTAPSGLTSFSAGATSGMLSSVSGAPQSGRSLNVFDTMAAPARPAAGGMPNNGASMMYTENSGMASAMRNTNMLNYGAGYGSNGTTMSTPFAMNSMPSTSPSRNSSSVTNAAAASSMRRLSKSSKGSGPGAVNTGFGFMQETTKKDAFDFVGDLF